MTWIMILFAAAAILQAAETSVSQNLFIAADYSCYKYSDDKGLSHVEIIYSLLRNQFRFQPDSTGFHARLDMTAVIRDSSGGVIDSNTWPAGIHIGSLVEADIPNFLTNDIVTAQLKPGDYRFSLMVKDTYSGAIGKIELPITVPAFVGSRLELSGIEFVYRILEPDGSQFVRGNRKIVPNTRRIFSQDDTVAYIYAESYNLDPALQRYSLAMRVFDAGGIIYKEIPFNLDTRGNSSAVILTGLNISAFRPGTYTLQLIAYDGLDTAVTEKSFDIIPGKLAWEKAVEHEELADFPEAIFIRNDADAKKVRDEILYIATRDELKQYESLNLEGKNNFIRSFWQRRDPDVSTPINENKIEHYRRLKYVNSAYSTFRDSGTEPNGWRTDMGRVYIVYGPPSDEENYPSAMGEIPWKKWNYDKIEGGVFFIFIDESGYGNYRLIHSTAKGEPKDNNWELRLKPSTPVR